MAPPTLSRLHTATCDKRYLDFLDHEYRSTFDKLFKEMTIAILATQQPDGCVGNVQAIGSDLDDTVAAFVFSRSHLLRPPFQPGPCGNLVRDLVRSPVPDNWNEALIN